RLAGTGRPREREQVGPVELHDRALPKGGEAFDLQPLRTHWRPPSAWRTAPGASGRLPLARTGNRRRGRAANGRSDEAGTPPRRRRQPPHRAIGPAPPP